MPVMGAFHRFMGVDEKVGGADEREDAEEAFICLMLWQLVRQREEGRRGGGGGVTGGGRGVEGKGKKRAARGRREESRGRAANKHIFMYGFPSAKCSATPGLINAEKRRRRHTWLGNDFHII